MNEDSVQVTERRTPYRGYFRIDTYRLRHRVFDQGWSEEIVREVFERGHAVAVLPYDPDADRVVLIEQFRVGAYCAPGFSPWQMECIAGIIDPGERPEDAAHREAMEETGLVLGDMVPVYRYLSSPGGTSESVELFCARVVAPASGGVHGLPHEHEFIRLHVVSSDEAFAMLGDGLIANSMTIIALQWLRLNRDRLRAEWSGD